ncbi:MAG: primosomal protein N' [Bacteroidales bacterium]
MEDENEYVDVLLPLPLRMYFTYRLPLELQGKVKIGERVSVPFGRHKIYAGLVRSIHSDTNQKYEIKSVISLLDEEPILHKQQFEFWQWMASYYMCTEGEVMAGALPSGFKLNNETKIIINPYFDGDITSLSEKQIAIIDGLEQKKELSLDEISAIVGQQKIFPLVRTLRDLGVVLIKEEISERFKPRKETWVRWSPTYAEDVVKQKELFDKLEKKAFKQLELVLAYLALYPRAQDGWVRKAFIVSQIENSQVAFAALYKRGVFEIKKKVVSRLDNQDANKEQEGEGDKQVHFSKDQQKAYEQIQEAFKEKSVCLLHGVTSSGKTEIFIELIRQALEQEKQVLYLLPEIALTSQMIMRLRKYFGDEVGVYHSRYNEHEKIEIWRHVGDKYKVILGARSALFLPFKNLGLIVVDEEHETSYKQQDPAPRYHARDAAIFLASLYGAKTLLGSATPSLETYYNALHKKYALVNLFTRYGNVALPSVFVSNLKEETHRKTMRGHLSSLLVKKMEAAFEKQQQVILFQNRRGFATCMECDSCQYIPICEHCDVSLTYHKQRSALICHYCGYTIPVPSVCPHCGGHTMKMKGFGTEHLEEELQVVFPQQRIARMDLDSTRAKNSHYQLISDFQQRKIDIMVGTQMVTKGLDFDNVGVVGVLNADSLITFPDFRSYERSFQLMTQVSGRAGRKTGEGEVVIQTYKPEYEVIKYVMNHDYASMYTGQIKERIMFKYPPFYRLIKLSVKHKEEALTNEAADVLARSLRALFGDRVLGPEYPMVSRIKTYFIKELLLKFERSSQLYEMKESLQRAVDEFSEDGRYKSVRVAIDVDTQ